MSDNVGDKPENGQNGEGDEEDLIFPEEEAATAADERSDLEKAHAERDRMREQLLASPLTSIISESAPARRSRRFVGGPSKTRCARCSRSSTTWSAPPTR